MITTICIAILLVVSLFIFIILAVDMKNGCRTSERVLGRLIGSAVIVGMFALITMIIYYIVESL